MSKWLVIGLAIFCNYMDRDEVEVHKNAKKKERTRPMTSRLDRTKLADTGFII